MAGHSGEQDSALYESGSSRALFMFLYKQIEAGSFIINYKTQKKRSVKVTISHR